MILIVSIGSSKHPNIMSLLNIKNNYASLEEIQDSLATFINGQEEQPRLVANDEGVIMYANALFKEITTHHDDIEGMRITDLITFDSPKDIYKNNTQDGQLKGSDRRLNFVLDWVDNNSQKILILSAHAQDNENENNQSNTPLSPFVKMSFDAQIIINKNGDIIEHNKNFKNMFATLKSHNIFDLIHEDSLKEFKSALKTRHGQDVITRAKGSNAGIWVTWAFEEHNQHVYILARNITERETHRIELEYLQDHIKEAEAIGSIGQWEWVVGHEDVNFSDQLYRIFGLIKNTDTPTLDSVNNMIHEDDDGRMMQVFQRAIIEQNNYNMDFRITRQDGEIRHIKCEGRCRVDEEDDVIALYGIMQDVTETMSRERDLRKAKESVEKAYAAKTQFLANMSHELRTPLNAVIGFSEMMERQLLGPIGNDKYLDYISGIRKSGEHLLSLISDILDMSKIEAGKYDLSLEDFNLSKSVQLAVHMVEGRALNEDVKINVHIESDKINIVADRRAMMQVMLNLLSNAVKFSKENSEVSITLKDGLDGVTITVSDDGIGIPANKLASITQPFEQVENHYSKEYEGTGLGLSITKELVEIHGGALNIESSFGVGTTVIVDVPKRQ